MHSAIIRTFYCAPDTCVSGVKSRLKTVLLNRPTCFLAGYRDRKMQKRTMTTLSYWNATDWKTKYWKLLRNRSKTFLSRHFVVFKLIRPGWKQCSIWVLSVRRTSRAYA